MIAGIVEYSSSSEDEEKEETNQQLTISSSAKSKPTSASNHGHKRNSCSPDPPSEQEHKRIKTSEPVPETSLPLPSSIQNLYAVDDRKTKDDSSQHGGRVRTFEHVGGNWATFVYVPVAPDERLQELFTSLLKCLRPYKFEMMTEFHVTLSRTVVIRHHWIQSLMDTLRESLSSCSSCICDVLEPRLYTNDEKTRTFVCLELQREGTNLATYVTAVDKCFQEFRLQSYYKHPSFHISFGWCLGDVTADVASPKLKQMKDLTDASFVAHPDLSVVEVREIECKTGNKVYRFQLQEDDR